MSVETEYPLPVEDLIPLFDSFIPYLASINYSVSSEDFTYFSAWKYKFLRWLEIFDELSEVLKIANKQVILVKGAALAFSVYPSKFGRKFGDADIFVHKRDFADVLTILLESGFKENGKPLAHMIHRSFSRDGFTVELHYNLSRDFAYPETIEELLFSKAIPFYTDAFFIPSPENHALYIILHALNHGFVNPPVWCVDLALLIDKYSLSSFKIYERAAKKGYPFPVETAFALAEKVLNRKFNVPYSYFADKLSELIFYGLKNGNFTDKIGLFTRFTLFEAINNINIEKMLNFLTSRW